MNNNLLIAELNINNKKIATASSHYDDNTPAHFEKLCHLIQATDVSKAITEQGNGQFILYSVKDKVEYHIRQGEDSLFILDCFSNSVCPSGKSRIIVIEDGGSVSVSDETNQLQRKLERDSDEKINIDDLFDATTSNKLVIVSGKQRCGCFSCKKIFPSDDIAEFTMERNGTESAICPYCGMDTVLPEKLSPIEITKELLGLIDTQ